MAKKIIWTEKDQQDRKKIFVYWNQRNKCNIYSNKLNKLFEEAVIIIANFPKIGKITNRRNSYRNPAKLKF